MKLLMHQILTFLNQNWISFLFRIHDSDFLSMISFLHSWFWPLLGLWTYSYSLSIGALSKLIIILIIILFLIFFHFSLFCYVPWSSFCFYRSCASVGNNLIFGVIRARMKSCISTSKNSINTAKAEGWDVSDLKATS